MSRLGPSDFYSVGCIDGVEMANDNTTEVDLLADEEKQRVIADLPYRAALVNRPDTLLITPEGICSTGCEIPRTAIILAFDGSGPEQFDQDALQQLFTHCASVMLTTVAQAEAYARAVSLAEDKRSSVIIEADPASELAWHSAIKRIESDLPVQLYPVAFAYRPGLITSPFHTVFRVGERRAHMQLSAILLEPDLPKAFTEAEEEELRRGIELFQEELNERSTNSPGH
jgi:hypothetical protein